VAVREARPGDEPDRPDPNADPAEWYRLMASRRAARRRTRQLVEWFGLALIVLGVELLFGVAWGIVAAGVAVVAVANAS